MVLFDRPRKSANQVIHRASAGREFLTLDDNGAMNSITLFRRIYADKIGSLLVSLFSQPITGMTVGI